MHPRRWLLVALAALALLLLAGRALADLYVDYRWYETMGAAGVWRAQALTTLLVRVCTGVAGMLFVFANVYAVRSSIVSLVLPRRVANLEIGQEVPGQYLLLAVLVVSVLLGALLSVPHDNWTAVALARQGIPFGESDPFFRLDLSFWVYWLPLEQSLFLWTLFATLVTLVAVTFLYALTPSLRLERGRIHASTYVRRHLMLFGVLALLLLAWSYRLDRFEALLSGSGPNGAFSYVDHHVTIPASVVLAVFTAAAAVVVGWAGWMGYMRLVAGGVIAVLTLSVLLRQVAPLVSLRLAEQADPVAREQPYEAIRAGYTRRAFATDEITRAEPTFGFRSPAEAARGVSLWDPAALAAALDRSRVPEASQPELAWLATPEGLQAVLPEHLPDDSRAPFAQWLVSRASAIVVDERGAPVHVSVPGLAESEGVQLVPTAVFPGAEGHVLVADTIPGLAATPLTGSRSRLAHAWNLQNFRLLSGDLPHPRPAIVRHRDVRQRVARLTPFFAQGSTITPAVFGDTIFWILPLYSSSATYPLSARLQAVGEARNYFRYAAAAVVNAVTGRVVVARDSALDPVARTWATLFPTLFIDVDRLPPSLASQLPPGIDAGITTAAAFAHYGSRSEGSAQRHLPWFTGADEPLAGTPNPPFTLPDHAGGAVAWALPLLGESERLQGIIVVSGGRRRSLRWLPVPGSSVRWPLTSNRLLTSTTEDAPEQGESAVVRGGIRAVPVHGEIALVQSAYNWRRQVTPTLARVSVLYRDSLMTGPTFAAAVGAHAPDPGETSDEVSFRGRVEQLYDRMRAAIGRADWSAFGAAYDSLGRLLGRAPR